MSKIYKGYELIKAIANGEIKEGTRFIDKTDTKYYEGTTVHTFKYQNNNFIQEKIGGINIVSILNHDFELIEEEQDIDIQTIEEIEWNEINGVGEEQDKFILSKGEKYLCSNYNDFEMVAILTINNLIEAVKKLDRKMNSSGQ